MSKEYLIMLFFVIMYLGVIMNIKNKIIEYSKLIDIDLIGFTDSDICHSLIPKLEQSRKLNFTSEFVKGNIEEKINPKLLMDSTKTIISIGIAYFKTCERLEKIKDDEAYFGNSSWGIDYHIVLREKMEKLCDYIKTIDSNLKYKAIVDTSKLDDRYIAYKAGLGFYGKNSLLINEKYGSYIFLGIILTNLELAIDNPINITCIKCNKCINACPSKAINDIGLLDSRKCLSYITQKKGILTSDEIALMNNCIYGCDICQRVCPYNIKNDNPIHEEFKPVGIEFINVTEYKQLTNKQFKNIYGKLAGYWRGKKIIERNINILKDKIKIK